MPDVSSSSTSPNLKYPVLSISDAVRTAPSGSAQRDRNVDADPWSVAVIFNVWIDVASVKSTHEGEPPAAPTVDPDTAAAAFAALKSFTPLIAWETIPTAEDAPIPMSAGLYVATPAATEATDDITVPPTDRAVAIA